MCIAITIRLLKTLCKWKGYIFRYNMITCKKLGKVSRCSTCCVEMNLKVHDLSDKISGLSNPPTHGRIVQHRLQHGRVQLGKEVFSKCHHRDLDNAQNKKGHVPWRPSPPVVERG